MGAKLTRRSPLIKVEDSCFLKAIDAPQGKDPVEITLVLRGMTKGQAEEVVNSWFYGPPKKLKLTLEEE